MTVCHGNICRSVMAKLILEHKIKHERKSLQDHDIIIDSSGISAEEQNNYMDNRAHQTLLKYGIDLQPHSAKQITKNMAVNQNLILPMTKRHAKYVHNLTGDLSQGLNSKCKIIMYKAFGEGYVLMPDDYKKPILADDVEDPWYGDILDFEHSFKQIEYLSDLILDFVQKDIAHI